MTITKKQVGVLSLSLLIATSPIQLISASQEITQEEKAFFDLITNMSEEEYKKMEADSQQAFAEIEKLPKEEQEKIWKEFDQLAHQLIEEVAPKMEQYFKQQEKDQEAQQKQSNDQQKQLETKPKKKAQSSKKPQEKVAKKKETIVASPTEAVRTVTSILDSLDTFTKSVQSLPTFDAQVSEWSESGRLRKWRPSLTWSFFKDQVSTLKDKLTELVVKDAQNNYTHLDALVHDQALYEKLVQLDKDLKEQTSANPLGEQELQTILTLLNQAINTQHLIGLITPVLAQ